MTARETNLDLYEDALIAKAEECKLAISAGRRALLEERPPEHSDDTLRTIVREAVTEQMERAHRLLRQTELALSRLRRGRFGRCLRCEHGIEKMRPQTEPWALFCSECQEGVDLLQYGARARRKDQSIHWRQQHKSSFWTEWQQDFETAKR